MLSSAPVDILSCVFSFLPVRFYFCPRKRQFVQCVADPFWLQVTSTQQESASKSFAMWQAHDYLSQRPQPHYDPKGVCMVWVQLSETMYLFKVLFKERQPNCCSICYLLHSHGPADHAQIRRHMWIGERHVRAPKRYMQTSQEWGFPYTSEYLDYTGEVVRRKKREAPNGRKTT